MNKKLKKICKNQSVDSCIFLLEEEAAELIQAASKYRRSHIKKDYVPMTTLKKSKAYDNLIEEIADVELLIREVKYMLSIKDKEINEAMDKKLKRAIKRTETIKDSKKKKEKKKTIKKKDINKKGRKKWKQ